MKPDRQRADSRAPEPEYDEDGLRRALGLKAADRPEHIKISNIRRDGGTQPRARLNDTVIDEYAAEMGAGARFPPVEVVYDGAAYWMWDGFHRVAAAEKAKLPTIEAHITQGTRRDAVLLSVGVNAEHGLRRTNEDKRRAVMTLLNDPEWSGWSNNDIARHCRVHPDTVGRIRKELSLSDSDSENKERTYITKHGTVATMNTSRIGRSGSGAAAPSTAAPSGGLSSDSSAPRVQGTAQPSGKFDGMDPDKLANLLRALNGLPPVVAMFIKHLPDEDVALMRRLELDKPDPRREVLLVLERRLGPGTPSTESIPDHDPAYELDLEPDEQPDMVTDHIPGDEQAGARRLLTEISTALQDLRSMALALPKLGDLAALAVLDDTALDGVLGLIDDTGADLAGHYDSKGERVPGLLDHLADWQKQVQEMLDDGNGAE